MTPHPASPPTQGWLGFISLAAQFEEVRNRAEQEASQRVFHSKGRVEVDEKQRRTGEGGEEKLP